MEDKIDLQPVAAANLRKFFTGAIMAAGGFDASAAEAKENK